MWGLERYQQQRFGRVQKDRNYTTKQKTIKFLWIYSGEIYKICMTFSPDFNGQNLGYFHGFNLWKTVKKAMKIFWNIPNLWPMRWQIIDYNKCSEKHSHEKAMTFFKDSWIWLFMGFSWCSGKGHEIYPYFSWCANSWQFNGMENSWVMIIPLTGNFYGPWNVFCAWSSDIFMG